MYMFKATVEDFVRPINTSPEDSIHMPQNHNNRNRRKKERALHVATSQTANLSAEARDASPQYTPLWDDASGAIHEIPSSPGWHRPTNKLGERANATNATEEVLKTEKENDAQQLPTLIQHRRGIKVSPLQIPGRISTHLGAKTAKQQVMRATQIPVPYSKTQAYTSIGSGTKDGKPAPLHSNVSAQQQPFIIPQRRPDYNTEPSSPTLSRIQNLRRSERKRTANEAGKDLDATKPTKSSNEPQVVAETVDASPRSFHPDSLINELAEAMQDLHVFQKITPSPYGTFSSGLDSINRSGLPQDGEILRESRDIKPGRRGIRMLQAETGETIQEEASKSKDSLDSLEDGFEKIEMPTSMESEHNGPRRKWYKRYLR
jgi:hypothetical protein